MRVLENHDPVASIDLGTARRGVELEVGEVSVSPMRSIVSSLVHRQSVDVRAVSPCIHKLSVDPANRPRARARARMADRIEDEDEDEND